MSAITRLALKNVPHLANLQLLRELHLISMRAMGRTAWGLLASFYSCRHGCLCVCPRQDPWKYQECWLSGR